MKLLSVILGKCGILGLDLREVVISASANVGVAGVSAVVATVIGSVASGWISTDNI